MVTQRDSLPDGDDPDTAEVCPLRESQGRNKAEHRGEKSWAHVQTRISYSETYRRIFTRFLLKWRTHNYWISSFRKIGNVGIMYMTQDTSNPKKYKFSCPANASVHTQKKWRSKGLWRAILKLQCFTGKQIKILPQSTGGNGWQGCFVIIERRLHHQTLSTFSLTSVTVTAKKALGKPSPWLNGFYASAQWWR